MLPPEPDETVVSIDVTDQISLEGLLSRPARPSGRALICHPNPAGQGTMRNKVVSASTRVAAAAGFATLRFNFRGVGKSSGTMTHGVSEVEDVVAAAAELSRQADDIGPFVLIGFSFGSWMAANAVTQGLKPRQLVLIGPPLDRYAFSPPPEPPRGITVILGDDDEFCSIAAAGTLVDDYHSAKVRLVVIDNCGHFFHGKLDQLAVHLEQALT